MGHHTTMADPVKNEFHCTYPVYVTTTLFSLSFSLSTHPPPFFVPDPAVIRGLHLSQGSERRVISQTHTPAFTAKHDALKCFVSRTELVTEHEVTWSLYCDIIGCSGVSLLCVLHIWPTNTRITSQAATHPPKPSLLLSLSPQQEIKLWNYASRAEGQGWCFMDVGNNSKTGRLICEILCTKITNMSKKTTYILLSSTFLFRWFEVHSHRFLTCCVACNATTAFTFLH